MEEDQYGRIPLKSEQIYTIGDLRIQMLASGDLEVDGVEVALAIRPRYANCVRIEPVRVEAA